MTVMSGGLLVECAGQTLPKNSFKDTSEAMLKKVMFAESSFLSGICLPVLHQVQECGLWISAGRDVF